MASPIEIATTLRVSCSQRDFLATSFFFLDPVEYLRSDCEDIAYATRIKLKEPLILLIHSHLKFQTIVIITIWATFYASTIHALLFLHCFSPPLYLGSLGPNLLARRGRNFAGVS